MLTTVIAYAATSTHMHTAHTPHTSHTSALYRRGGCSDCTTSHVSLLVIVMWSCTAWVQSMISQIGVTLPRNDSLLVYVSQCHKHCDTPLLSIATPAHSYSIYRFTFICTTIIIPVHNYNIIGVSLQLLHMRGRYKWQLARRTRR